MRPVSRARRGSVVIVVVWAVAIAAVLVAATQVVSFRQAVLGREALARVQARWAARAGVEQMIALMEFYHQHPEPDDPMALVRDMEAHAIGATETGAWDIRHSLDGVEWAGPLDEGAKLNINRATRMQLMALPRITPDVVDAIVDWRDPDNDVQGMGAEADYYRNRGMGYRPRNGNFKSIAELELVAGAWPSYVRGEDWNLNSRLDPNEDDGSRSFPDDKPDGKLDAGWSGLLTARSIQSKYAPSGEPRISLANASIEDLMARTGVDETQAKALTEYGRQNGARVENLISIPLSQIAAGGMRNNAQGNKSGQGGSGGSGGSGGLSGRSSGGRGSGQNAQANGPKDLTDAQLRAVLRETTTEDFSKPVPGRINLNTAPVALLKDVLALDPRVADAIVARRRAKPEGITSLAELPGIGGMNATALATLTSQCDVQSSVYTVTSRGRALSTGAEVEIEVVVDRSEIPARILSYREQ
jgi:DNA uptake protein ComE-like DNA-binding protein